MITAADVSSHELSMANMITGSDGIMALEYGGQLTHRYLIKKMIGFAGKSTYFRTRFGDILISVVTLITKTIYYVGQ
jgi:hypothetical protein